MLKILKERFVVIDTILMAASIIWFFSVMIATLS